jgi:FecR protein
MNKDPHDVELERLLARAGRPSASPAFRARVKQQFLAPEPVMVRQRTRMFPFVWPFVLAASVAFILHYVLSQDAKVRWHVVGTDGGGEFIVDGRRIHSSEGPRLLDAVQTAHEIETFTAGLRLKLNDDLLLEIAPKTRVSQLSFPAAHMYSIYTNAGSLRITTGPTFDGQRLRVMTDDMETAVVGTTFAVDVEALGTCLCCIAGTVKCDARDGRGMVPTEAGHMCYAFHSGKKPEWGMAMQQHAEPLEKLKSFAAALWKTQ